MSNIVYSTEISDKTRNLYKKYQTAKKKHGIGTVACNSLWIQFCDACDAEGKQPLSVVDKLIAE